jgi:hypothetical protein
MATIAPTVGKDDGSPYCYGNRQIDPVIQDLWKPTKAGPPAWHIAIIRPIDAMSVTLLTHNSRHFRWNRRLLRLRSSRKPEECDSSPHTAQHANAQRWSDPTQS